MFAIKLDQTNGDFITNPLFNITWEHREYTTATDGSKIKTTVSKNVQIIYYQLLNLFPSPCKITQSVSNGI